jgi:hypothetical protein
VEGKSDANLGLKNSGRFLSFHGMEGLGSFMHRVEDALAADFAREADAFEDQAQGTVGMGELQGDALLV